MILNESNRNTYIIFTFKRININFQKVQIDANDKFVQVLLLKDRKMQKWNAIRLRRYWLLSYVAITM